MFDFNPIRVLARFGVAALTAAAVVAQPLADLEPLVSTNLTDPQFVEFSTAEPRFSVAAFPVVKARICALVDGAQTSYGQPFISELRTVRAVVPPETHSLTNALRATRLYLDYSAPTNMVVEESAAWTELGFILLERGNSVLHHYYLAPEYRRGHEASLKALRGAARELAARLTVTGLGRERLDEIKARYATLWFERSADVLPVYRAVIHDGARGAVREALVLRTAELPLIAGWTWDELKRADAVQKQFIQDLSSSTNAAVRMEGLLLGLARTRSDRAFASGFTNVLEAIGPVERADGTRVAYAEVIKDLLQDRYSRTITEKTRNELRGLYEARFMVATPAATNAVALAGTNAVTSGGATQKVANASVAPKPKAQSKPAPATKDLATAKSPAKAQKPVSWQLLLTESDIRFWETMPMTELRAMADAGDVIANYYVFLRLRNSDSAELSKASEAGLLQAFKADFAPAQLEYALRQEDAEERFHWTKKSAGTGYPQAQLALGKLHVMGHGTPVDLERGLSLARGAYDLKVPEAEAVLAELYASGIGQPRSTKERPEKLFLSAARNNQPAAMLELHQRFLNGYGVVRDHLEASRWIVNVGIHDKTALDKYLDDDGKARPQVTTDLDDFSKTLAVYAQAVIHKQADAIGRVAEWYEQGSIGRKSPLRAFALLTLGGNSEKIKPASIDRAKSALSPNELRTAEILVGQWQKIQPDLL